MPLENTFHILLFDPDIQLAVPLVKELRSAGYQVTHITAWETKAALAGASYDALVVAWLEPSSSPLQVLPQWLRQQSLKCPFILAVAPEQLVNAAYLQSSGIQGFISRPYAPDEASKTIREVALRQELEAKGRRLERAAILKIAANIFSVRDERQLLDRIVQTLVDTFGYKVAFFRLIEPDGSLDTYACAGTQINYVGTLRYRLPPGAGITGQVVRYKRPIAIRDLRKDSSFYFPDMKERESMVAMLSVPLTSGDAVLGVLSCYLGEPHEFSDDEIQFVSQWANVASIAINNARLIKIQNQVSLFSRELAQTSNLKSVLQIVVYHAQQLAGADGVSVFLYNAEKERFELKDVIHLGIGYSPRLARKERPPSEGISMMVLRDGVKRVEDVDREVQPAGPLTPGTRDELVQQEVHAFIGIALQASRSAGILFLNYRRAGYLPPSEMLKPLETLAYQAALAIERVRENEHRKHERSLLTLATDVTASINSKDAVYEAWTKLLQAAMALTGAKVGNISVITPDGRHLNQIADEGFPDGYVRTQLEVGGKSIQGQVAQLKEPVLIHDVKNDPVWSKFYHEGVKKTKSELTVPIIEPTNDTLDKHILGIVNLEHDEESAFGEHDKRLVEMICEHAKIVIKIAQDWEMLTKRQDQLNALFSSAQTISAMLDKETLLETILEQAAARLAGAHFATIQRKTGDRLKFEAVYPPELMEQLLSQIPNGEMPLNGNGLTVKAARTRQPVRVGNVNLRSDFVEVGGKVTKAELAVPVLVDGEVWGVLNVESPDLEAFDENDEKTLIALTKLFVTALKFIEHQGELDAERERRASTETANEFAVLTLYMAHRLKGLLTNIPPDARKINESLVQLDAVDNILNIHHSLEQITQVSEAAIEILSNIRQPFIFKLERRVDPAAVLNSVLETIGPLSPTVIRTREWSEDRIVIASPELLADVFKNLLDNSRDAMPHGGVISISIGDSQIEQTEWLSITVRDNGTGMSKETLDRLRQFLPGYSTKDDPAHEAQGGLGFGLYIANWFVRRLGGSLEINSRIDEPDRGTAVTLTLPKDTERQWTYLMLQEQRRDADGFNYRRGQ